MQRPKGKRTVRREREKEQKMKGQKGRWKGRGRYNKAAILLKGK